MLAMGYGLPQGSSQATQATSDDGIDGIIKKTALVSTRSTFRLSVGKIRFIV